MSGVDDGSLVLVKGVVNVIPDKLEALPLGEPARARDFRGVDPPLP